MVHHVHVNEIGVGNGLKVTFQIAEVSGQDARCDLNSHGSHSMEVIDLMLLVVGLVIGI